MSQWTSVGFARRECGLGLCVEGGIVVAEEYYGVQWPSYVCLLPLATTRVTCAFARVNEASSCSVTSGQAIR